MGTISWVPSPSLGGRTLAQGHKLRGDGAGWGLTAAPWRMEGQAAAEGGPGHQAEAASWNGVQSALTVEDAPEHTGVGSEGCRRER